jgi:hypothetical protein
MMRIVADQLRQERAYTTVAIIAAAIGERRSAVRRALLSMERRGEVIAVQNPKRWALVKGRRARRPKQRGLAGQLELSLLGGSVRSFKGGILWD